MASGTVEERGQEAAQQQQQAQQPGGGARSQLVQQLIEAANLPAFMNSLLTAQAITVAGTEAAGFLLERGAEDAMSLRPIAHVRPDQSSNEARTAALNAFQELVRPCIQQNKDGAIEVGGPNDAAESQFCLVTLLRADNAVVAVSAVVTRCMNLERARQRLMSMQLVAGYFELFTLRRAAEQNRTIAETHQHAMQLSTSVATAEGFASAAMNLCNELATRSGATRVSLGWIKGKNIKVKALSHTEEFDKKQELVVQLEKVMEECVDQEQLVQFDPTGQNSSDNVTRDAAQLSRTQGGHSVLSLPLRQGHDIVGVVTLEFLPGQQPSPTIARGLSVAVDLLAPQLYDRHQNDRWLITKVGLSIRDNSKLLLGPRHMLAKLIVILSVLAIGIMVQPWFQPTYHVSAPFEFAPITPHSVSAPYDGYIKWIARVDENGVVGRDGVRKIKPGDHVKAGDVLVELNTIDMQQKQIEATKQRDAKDRQYQIYRTMGESKTADAMMAKYEADAYGAEAKLLQVQIDRGVIRAPEDGIVLKGDLEDKLSAPVKQGDPLFEIGSSSNLRIEMYVADRDIQEIRNPDPKNPQIGRFATNALPDEKFTFEVDRIIPMSETREGGNVFKVYGNITGRKSMSWRPGMTGEARIDAGDRKIIWICTHRLVDFVRLKLWM